MVRILPPALVLVAIGALFIAFSKQGGANEAPVVRKVLGPSPAIPAKRLDDRIDIGGATREASSAFTEVAVVVTAESGAALADVVVEWSTADGRRSRGRTGLDGSIGIPADRPLLVRATLPGRTALEKVVVQEGSIELPLAGSASLSVVFVDSAGLPIRGVGALVAPTPRPDDSWGNAWPVELAALRDAWQSDPRRSLLTLGLADGATKEEQISRLEEVLPELVQRRRRDCIEDLHATYSSQAGELIRQATSGEDGRITWTGLPAGASFQWALTSAAIGTSEPPHPELVPLSGSDRKGQEALRLISAPLVLEHGEHRELRMTATRVGVVHGRIAAPGAALDGAVRLRRASVVEGPGGAPANAWLEQDALRITPDGSFEFDNVPPGQYWVHARWVPELGEHHMAEAYFELPEGERHDVGALHARTGQVLEARLQFTMRTGEVVPEHELFEGNEVPRFQVFVNSGDGVPRELDVTEMLAVAAGETFRLNGLAPGQYLIEAIPTGTWPSLREGWQLRRGSTFHELHLSGDGEHVVSIEVERPGHVRLVVPFPAAASAMRGRGSVLNQDTGEVRSLSFGTYVDHDVTRVVGDLALPEGSYWVRASFWSEDADLSEAGQYLDLPVEVKPGMNEEYVVVADQGTDLVATVRDADGAPVGGRFVQLTPVEHLNGEDVSWLYSTRTDADGSLRLSGLPPHALLAVRRSDSILALGGPGEVRSADILRR